MSKVIICISLLFCTYMVSAQEDNYWTLEQCISYALENNINVLRQKTTIASKRVELSKAKWAFSPIVSMNSSHSLSAGRVLDPTTYDFIENNYVNNGSTSISGNIILFSGMERHHAYKRAIIDQDLANVDLETLKRELSIAICSSYYELLCTMDNIKTIEEILELLNTQEHIVQVKVNAGVLTESDLLQIKSRIYSVKNDYANIMRTYKLAKMELCQLMEIQDQDKLAITELNEEVSPSYILVRHNNDTYLNSRPEYNAAKLNLKIAETNLKVQKASYWPRISMSVGYGTSFSDARYKTISNADGTLQSIHYGFMDQYRDNSSAYISLNVDIPLFAGMRNRNNVKQAKLAAKVSEYEIATVVKQMTQQYEQVCTDIEVAKEVLFSATEQLSYTKEVTRQISEKYNQGLVDFIAWNTAITELYNAQNAYNLAKYQLALNVRLLDFYQ